MIFVKLKENEQKEEEIQNKKNRIKNAPVKKIKQPKEVTLEDFLKLIIDKLDDKDLLKKDE